MTALALLAVVQSQECDTLRRLFKAQGWSLIIADTVGNGLSADFNSGPTIVMLDRDLASPDWRPVVRQFASHHNCACVILASRVIDDYLWEEVIKYGGYDVLAKPFQERELIHTLEFAWSVTKSRLSVRHTG